MAMDLATFIAGQRFLTLDEVEAVAVLIYKARAAPTTALRIRHSFDAADIVRGARRRWQKSVAHIDTKSGPVKVCR